jgi:hypothetical protein
VLHEQLESLKAWFGGYVRGFCDVGGAIQDGIKLKQKHTRRVCEKIVRIGLSLGLEEEDLRLAEAAALFHDVGRFRQYADYRTFNDRRSENHALLGVRELERSGILLGLAKEDRDIITTAVRCHNLLDLPPGLDGRSLLFARLIRDADKLDILEVFTDHFARPDRTLNRVLESGLPDTPEYSPDLVERLLQEEMCSYERMKNYNDRKLLMLSWIYDINYTYTVSEIAGNGYIEKTIQSLPDTGDIRRVYGHLREYVARRLSPAGA